jgi:hypothetical protein
MAQTVAQHSVATFTTPVNGTSPIDATTVRGNDNTLRVGYNDHDADPGVHLQSSLLASRPAAGESGRKWLTTDVAALKVYFDTGSAWSEISYLPLSGGTVAGNVSITGTLAVTGVLTATGGVVGNVTGNASTATALATARAINGVNFDGTAAITVTAAAGTLTGATLASNVLASSLTSVGTLAALTVTAPITGSVTGSSGSTTGNAATATALQTARTINGTSFDGTANVTVTAAAGTLTGATLASNVLASSLTSVGTLAALTVTAPITGSVTGSSGSATGNAATATALQTARTINGTSFDGTANITVTAAAGTLTGSTLASGVTASSLTSVGTLSSVAVSGTTALNSVTYTWPAADGTNGYVLSTNGTGTLSWAAGGGGGGTTTNSLTAGTYLTGSPFNGSAAITFAVDATDANTASKVVARDASGNFSAGTVTAALTGNASTATALQTARAINGTNFDGTAAITVTAAAGTLTGASLASGVTASSLTSVGTLTSLAVTGDLTVDTSTLKVDSTNNRVGVVNASPAYTLDVGGNANVSTGSTYKVNGVDTLSATTLGSAVAASSLTSVGTLTALTMGGTVSMADNVIGRPRFTDYAETYSAPTISSGTLTLNIENGNVFRASLNANITTLTISNPSGTGNACSFTLIFNADGTARTVTWPAAVKWPGGTSPTLTSTASRSDMFVFYTNTAGTTWYAMTAAQNFVTT